MDDAGAVELAAPARPRIERPLARRLDRLARRAHRFHRYAHHPLCGAYAGELIRLGRRGRVCRGCASAMAGALLGAAVASALPVSQLNRLTAGSLAALLALQAVALLLFFRRARAGAQPSVQRTSKLVARALPALLLAGELILGLRRADPVGLGLAFASLAAVAVAWLGYRRRGPDRTPCASCPQGPPRAECPGFAQIVRRERAFRRATARLLALR